MKTVRIQVIKVYDINVDATNDDDAISKAYDMQTTTIEDKGVFIDASTDYAEVI